MKARWLALLSTVALVPSCKGGGDDDDEVRYFTTYNYVLRTAETSLTNVTAYLMAETDIDVLEGQTGITQNAGAALIFGQVVDMNDGTGLDGVTVELHNDSGLPSGSVFYQSAVTGQYIAGLQETSTTGRFVGMNIVPGRINFKCAAGGGGGVGGDGNVYLLAGADTCVYVTLSADPTKDTVTWGGVTQRLGAAGSAVAEAPEPAVTYTRIGNGGSTGPSDGSGVFSFGSVNAYNAHLVRAGKAGFVDTYNYKQTVTTNLTSGAGGGDLYIITATDRDNQMTDPLLLPLTAGTGFIRGRVMDASGGFVVEAFDTGGTAVGTVRYGDNADNGRPTPVLTATQANGIFYICNVPPGQIMIRASKSGAVANAYVESFADAITLPLDLLPASKTVDTITISGALRNLSSYGVREGNIRLLGTGVGTQSDQFNGGYFMTGVPTRQTFIVVTSK